MLKNIFLINPPDFYHTYFVILFVFCKVHEFAGMEIIPKRHQRVKRQFAVLLLLQIQSRTKSAQLSCWSDGEKYNKIKADS